MYANNKYKTTTTRSLCSYSIGLLSPNTQKTKKRSYHEGLDHDSRDALEAHDEDGFGTLFCGGAAAIADGMLGLDAEEEAGSEAVYLGYAGGPGVVVTLENTGETG